MSKPKLTIGMATFDDFHGVYFSVQALRMYHADAMAQCELIVIDNNPDGSHGKMTEDFVGRKLGNDIASMRYIPMSDAVGTSQPRNRIFKEAAGNAVICMDCHVLPAPGSIQRLIEYYDEHPETNDLLSGPMLYDDLQGFCTHFDAEWRAEMWGTWGSDERGRDPEAEPFEIPAMGLGMFSCRKDAWLGFNEHFRGFGGEELYIHEKFRQAGAKALCLPFLRWGHRFGRPDGIKYPLTRFDKIRNYVLGHAELGLPLDPIKEHFVDSGLMPAAEWAALIENPETAGQFGAETAEDASCGTCGSNAADKETRTLDELYADAVATKSDFNEHCEKLKELASQCDHVTDFGSRASTSTVALLAGQPEKIVSYVNDRVFNRILTDRQGESEFITQKGDSLTTDIEETDMLFIDTRHTADHFLAELERLAPKVRRWIVRHDTQIYGERGEDGGAGLLPAMRKFMADNPEWSVFYHTVNNYGLTVISRDERDKPKLPGIITMGANFAKAVADHVADGGEKVDAKGIESRLEVCTMCDQRNDNQCAACGCYLAEKASWRSGICPLGKWPAVEAELELANAE